MFSILRSISVITTDNKCLHALFCDSITVDAQGNADIKRTRYIERTNERVIVTA